MPPSGSSNNGGSANNTSNGGMMMTKNIYQNSSAAASAAATGRQYTHHGHLNTHQYPTGAAAAAVMSNAMANGLGRYTSAQMNSMSSSMAAVAAAANSPYNSMAAAQFTPNPGMNFQDHMLHYQSY